ncbi:MAG: Holliday junction branch migration protein RuvA [Gemmatimonadota bacterium]
MIATVTGVLAEKGPEVVVIQTDGGVGYAVSVPLGVFERLPMPGTRVTLFTELVVREDGWSLYGFDRPLERTIFQRLLTASGFGPRLALALLSALGPERTVRSVREKDIAALSTVSGIGKKKAERLILELHDRFDDVNIEATTPRAPGIDDAVQALVRLGYTSAAADAAVRAAVDGAPPGDTAAIIRQALRQLAATRGGR